MSSRLHRFAGLDPDKMVADMLAVAPRIEVQPVGRSFAYNGRLARLAATGLFEIRVECGTVLSDARDYLGVTLALDNPFWILEGRKAKEFSAPHAHLLKWDEPFAFRSDQNTGRVLVANFDRAMVTEVAQNIEMAEGAAPLPDALSLRSIAGTTFRRYIRFVWGDVVRGGLLTKSALAARETERALITSLLLAAQDDARRGKDATSADEARLRHVRDFIEANLTEPIGLADLAAVAGMRVDTLCRTFTRHHDASPMRYVRRRRLDAVHRRLQAADPRETTVTEVALEFGFAHLGRFAGAYGNMFGERPSDTLRS